MRLVRFGEPGHEQPGLIDSTGQLRDMSGVIRDIDGEALGLEAMNQLRRIKPEALPVVADPQRLGPCVGNVGKIIGVAINYRMHGEETGSKIPAEPTVFLKATSSLSGAEDPILLPPGSEKLDWEVEFGIVIGRRAQNIKAADAMNHIAGYCVIDDVSERAFQLERGGQQHTKGKSYDSFCPLGPWLVTKDEIPDPQNLHLWLSVNGEMMQDGTTRDMLFPVAELVAYISEFMTLLPGDVIASGTPDGVGRGKTPPRYLKKGDVVALGIDGLGQQSHIVK